MTNEEFNALSPAERETFLAEEFERCKDQYYLYHTYYRLPDGSLPRQYTREEWDAMMVEFKKVQDNWFTGRMHRRRPL